MLDAAMVRLLLGGIALAFSLDYWLALRPRAGPTGPSVVRGGFWAALAGFTSFVAHAGGPPLNVYMLPERLEKRVFVGTLAIFFAVVNWLKVVPYAMLGHLNTANLTTSLAILPLAPVGIWLGLWMQKRVSDRVFYRLCYGLLFLTGLKLMWDGIAGVA